MNETTVAERAGLDPAVADDDSGGLAAGEICRILSGERPSTRGLAEFGEWGDIISTLRDTYSRGETGAVRQVIQALVKLNPRLGSLISQDIPQGPLSGATDQVRRMLGPGHDKTELPPLESIRNLAELEPFTHQILAPSKIPARDRRRVISFLVCELLMKQGRLILAVDNHGGTGTPFIVDDDNAIWPLEERSVQVSKIVRVAGLNATEPAFRWIIADLDAAARQRAPTIELSHYVARRNRAIYVSSGPSEMVKATDEDLQVVPNGTDEVFFSAEAVLPPWKPAAPMSPFELAAFNPAWLTPKDASAYTPDMQKLLLEAWLTAILLDARPLPLVTVLGDRDGGKTGLVRAVTQLMLGKEPTTLSEDSRDIWALAVRRLVLGLDNLDSEPPSWLADVLAALVTGVSYSRRRLYTLAETDEQEPRAVVLISTRTASFARPDVAQRTLPILTRAFRDHERESDASLADEIVRHRSAILTYLVQNAARMACSIDSAPSRLPGRFVDFARVVWAFSPDQAVEALTALQQAQAMTIREADPLLSAVIEYSGALLSPTGVWQGRATDLLKDLREAGAEIASAGGGKVIAGRIREGAAMLALFGLHVCDNNSTGQTIFRLKRM